MAVYADGTIVASELNRRGDLPGSAASVELVVRSGRLTAPQLADLRASVTGLGMLRGTDQSAGCYVSEGEDIALGRFDGTTSRLTTWMLASPMGCSGSPPGFNDQAERVRQLSELLQRFLTTTSVEAPTGWALLAAPPHSSGPPARSDWLGPDPATLPTDGPFGERCAVLNGETIATFGARLSITPEGTVGVAVYEVNSTPWRIWLRPLLPHEHTCHDIDATAAALRTTVDNLEAN